MHFCVPSERQLIQGTIDEEQDLRQMKNIFFISQICCYHGGTSTSGSAAEPNHIPMLEERVDTLSNQVIVNFPLLRICQQVSRDGSA